MKRLFVINLLMALVLVGVSGGPVVVSAANTDFNSGVVQPCTGGDFLFNGSTEKECTVSDFISLVTRIIDYAFFFSIPLTAITFSYAGYLYLTAGGNSSKISQANGIFTKVLMGFVVMLSAWLIVKLVATSLLRSDINLPINLGN